MSLIKQVKGISNTVWGLPGIEVSKLEKIKC